jgi:hypothetical protein
MGQKIANSTRSLRTAYGQQDRYMQGAYKKLPVMWKGAKLSIALSAENGMISFGSPRHRYRYGSRPSTTVTTIRVCLQRSRKSTVPKLILGWTNMVFVTKGCSSFSTIEDSRFRLHIIALSVVQRSVPVNLGHVTQIRRSIGWIVKLSAKSLDSMRFLRAGYSL